MDGARKRLVVIGGDAGGLSAAAQARRLRSAAELEIVVLEQGPEASYSACGIPYWIGDLVPDRDALIARTPAQFAAQDIDLRIRTRVDGIDLAEGTVTTADGDRIGYDDLLVATGGRPPRPPGPGLDAGGGERGPPRPPRRARGCPGGTPTGCTASTGSPTAPPSGPPSPPAPAAPSSSAGAT